MADIPLKKFVERAAQNASRIFEKTGQLLPMYHFIDSDGREGIMPSPARDKDEAVATARRILAERGATRVVFMDEAWMLDRPTELEAREADRVGISRNPKRIEVVMFAGEDQIEGVIMARREIIRHGNRALLGKLEIFERFDQAEGRMVGLLPNKGAKH